MKLVCNSCYTYMKIAILSGSGGGNVEANQNSGRHASGHSVETPITKTADKTRPVGNSGAPFELLTAEVNKWLCYGRGTARRACQ